MEQKLQNTSIYYERFFTAVAALGLAAISCLLPAGCSTVNPDPVFNVPAILDTPLNSRILKVSEKDGIVTEEVMFHSEMDGDKSVDIFAYFSYPSGARGLPAFVWNQGGLARATTNWTEFGARRGYAALCIDFPMPGYRSTGEYPITELVLTDDLKKAPLYHGAVALLKAVSFLASRPEVNPERIGMIGGSWGGFYTTMMAGIDPRLKVASSFFGCGGLEEGCVWFNGVSRDPSFSERWRTTLDPAWRLAETDIPVAWGSATNDHYYWMPALMKTFQNAAGPKHLQLIANWDHGMTPVMDEEMFVWLDIYLKGAPKLLEVSPVKVSREGDLLVAEWSFSGPRSVKSAEIMVGYGESGNWKSRPWTIIPASINGKNCRCILPSSSIPYFISASVVDIEGFISSTPLLRVAPSEHGIPGLSLPEIDGCAQWGDFEGGQFESYVKLNGYLFSPLVEDAKSGRTALRLPSGARLSTCLEGGLRGSFLPPVRFVAGLPVRISCWMKADQSCDVLIGLAVQLDDYKRSIERQFQIRTEWTEISLELETVQANFTSMVLSFSVPEGRNVLLDCIRSIPLPPRKGQ